MIDFRHTEGIGPQGSATRVGKTKSPCEGALSSFALRVDGDFPLVEANHSLGIGQGTEVRFRGLDLDPLRVEGYILLGLLEEHFCEDESGGSSDVHNKNYNGEHRTDVQIYFNYFFKGVSAGICTPSFY